MRIETVRFQRKENSEWEFGIIINEGSGPLIDSKGNVVPVEPQIWKWTRINDHVMTVWE